MCSITTLASRFLAFAEIDSQGEADGRGGGEGERGLLFFASLLLSLSFAACGNEGRASPGLALHLSPLLGCVIPHPGMQEQDNATYLSSLVEHCTLEGLYPRMFSAMSRLRLTSCRPPVLQS